MSEYLIKGEIAMPEEGSIYETELIELYTRYEEKIIKVQSFDEALGLGVRLQKDMGELNIKYRLWNDSKGYDHDSIYYTAAFLVEKCTLPEIYQLDADNAENRKEQLSEILFKMIDQDAKKRIHAIEPHPDDVLGSASGLCYSAGAFVTLHTISRTLDERDSVFLHRAGIRKYQSIRKRPNIIEHFKYNLEDFHWDNRNMDINADYGTLLQEYVDRYGAESVSLLMEKIEDIIKSAQKEDAYVAFPLGIEHPMHMLVAYACVEQIKKQHFDIEKVIIYVDHPYDFQNVGTGRLQKARDYIRSELCMKLCRCDDLSIDQSVLKNIISEIYGEKHYGEFDGSLENTFCSYFINYTALDTVRKFLKIHVNNVLYITAQAKPYYKTGGLGEVAYVYCKALKDFVNDVRIMMPKYSGDDIKSVSGDSQEEGFEFHYKGSTEEIGDLSCKIENRLYNDLNYYLLDIEGYFEGRNRFDSGNHGKIFAVFCDAIMQKGLSTIDYVPSVLHCNDWQTALIPMLKKTKYEYYRPELKVIYTVHFYGYKGIFKKRRILEYVGLDKEKCRLCVACNDDCPMNRIDMLSNEDLGKLNVTPSQMSFMKAGIEFADAVSTVSKGYAEEIQRYPDFSGVKVIGIRNGIDHQRYKFAETSGFADIETGDFQELKRRNKDKLQEKLGLKRDTNIPVICMVSRLTVVKGIEVVKNIVREILAIPAQFVIIGDDDTNGDNKGIAGRPYENFFHMIENENPGMLAYRRFSEELEYETYAGADILLMPSLSEACGTTQMNAMKYGVVPIVSMISAFNDTVLDFKDREKKKDPKYWGKGIGFYAYKDDCWVLLEVLKKAVEIYQDNDQTGIWNEIARDCAAVNFGWKNESIREYLDLYNGLQC